MLDAAPGYVPPPDPPMSAQEMAHGECLDGAPHRVELLATVSRSNVKMIRAHCWACDASTTYIKHTEVADLFGRDVASVPVERSNACTWCDATGCALCCPVPCERCRRYKPTHRHHTAPRALFEDADYWPIVSLCQECHTYWHQVMTPNLRRNLAPVAAHLRNEWDDYHLAQRKLIALSHDFYCLCAVCGRWRVIVERFHERYGHQYSFTQEDVA